MKKVIGMAGRAAALAALFATAGCAAGVAVGALATTGVAVTQERTTRQAMTDTEIRISVNNRLLNEDRTLFANISTEVVEGRVLLAGAVPSQRDRMRAGELVWQTPGVVELINELTVGESADMESYARDVWISTQIRTRLLTDGEVDSINYNIETIEQVVHLIGIARSEEELERVVGIASEVPGVKRVVSHVLTKSDKRRVAAAG